jgi:hypothetical protein
MQLPDIKKQVLVRKMKMKKKGDKPGEGQKGQNGKQGKSRSVWTRR